MSDSQNDSNLLLPDADSQGWFKLVIPTISDIFGALWDNPSPNSQIELLPFIYCKLDPELVAFDIELSQPMYAVDKVCLVQIDRASQPGSKNKTIPVVIMGLSVLSSEQENRCFLPTTAVSCIIPIRPDHVLIDTFKVATSESCLVEPTTQEARSIISLPGNPPLK